MRRWEELRDDLDAHDVHVVTVSSEKPSAIRAQRAKHGLRAVMLGDADASIIERLGIVNRGVHTGPPGGARLPIPTTVLTDARGIVRWIDQSENYQWRSDPDRVRAALAEHLGREGAEVSSPTASSPTLRGSAP